MRHLTVILLAANTVPSTTRCKRMKVLLLREEGEKDETPCSYHAPASDRLALQARQCGLCHHPDIAFAHAAFRIWRQLRPSMTVTSVGERSDLDG